MRINEKNFPLIANMLSKLSHVMADIDDICVLQGSCEDCIMNERPDGIAYCIKHKLVAIRNQIATDKDYQEYLRQYNSTRGNTGEKVKLYLGMEIKK